MAAPAHNLEHAFNMLNPQHALTPEEVPQLFVERPDSPTVRIVEELVSTTYPLKFLFVGHRGAGKTSELAYLSTRLGPKFLSVPIPLWQMFGGPSVSHTELLLGMNLRLLRAATDEKVVPRGLVNAVWEDWFRNPLAYVSELLVGSNPTAPSVAIAEVSAEVNLLATKLETKISVDSVARKKVEERLRDRLPEMLDRIGELVTLLEAKLKRQVVLFVEDLDKFDRKSTCELFLEHATTLTSPRAHVIYSFPVSMRFTSDFHQISQSFNDVHYLPNISLRHRDRTPDPEGMAALREILGRRIAPELFAEGVAERAVALSGGHVKSLIQLVQRAVINAKVDDSPRINLDHLAKAAAKSRDDFIRYLSRDQIHLLRAFRENSDRSLSEMDEARQALLYNGSLLEYGNTNGPWGDVNPVVEEILDRYAR